MYTFKKFDNTRSFRCDCDSFIAVFGNICPRLTGCFEIMGNARISTRINVGFACAIVLTGLMAAAAVWVILTIGSGLTTINDVNGVKQRLAINFRGSVHDRAVALRDAILLDDGAPRQGVLDKIEALDALYQDAAIRIDEIFAATPDIRDEERAILAAIKEAEAEAMPLVAAVIDAEVRGKFFQAQGMLVTDARPAMA